MLRPRLATLLASVSLACGLYLSAAAQTVTGTLSGTVTDVSGAVLADIEVTAKNVETGLARTTKTNGEGYYLMSFLPLGAYNVTVEARGFKKTTKTDLQIELNKNTVSNFKLEISAVGEAVQITGETPQIETTTGEIKHSLDEKT